MIITSPAPILPGPLAPVESDAELEAAQEAASADFSSFLTLLTAQLRNQDPLEPIESTEFIAQLASFSSVEQLVSVNDRLDAMAGQSLSGDIAAFSAWIGRDIAVSDGSFRGTGEEVFFNVPDNINADRVEAIVRDSFGTELRRFAVTSGTVESWDGADALGIPVVGRDLGISLAAFQGGASGEEVPAEVLRRVTGLRGTEDGLVLDLADGGTALPEQVSRVSDHRADE
jgi:flagellar basal-body rod modification protein FlgD